MQTRAQPTPSPTRYCTSPLQPDPPNHSAVQGPTWPSWATHAPGKASLYLTSRCAHIASSPHRRSLTMPSRSSWLALGRVAGSGTPVIYSPQQRGQSRTPLGHRPLSSEARSPGNQSA
ncbi:hypothetical protein HMPREF9594_01426 [Cutibacterium acnes HL005PA1]|nr:hypothetical protein HMPREF9594_01426 [Cutibacterium acnes HL005PA1]